MQVNSELLVGKLISACLTPLALTVNLCVNLKVDYRLFIVFVVALNPKQSLPYIDHLEKAYNMEIQSNAERDVAQCKEFLHKKYAGKVG